MALIPDTSATKEIMVIINIKYTVYVEILAGIKFGDMAPNWSFKSISGILI